MSTSSNTAGSDHAAPANRWYRYLLMSWVALLVAATFLTGDSTSVAEGMMTWPLLAWFGLLFAWSVYQFRFQNVLLRVDVVVLLLVLSTVGMLFSLMMTSGSGDDRGSLNVWWQWAGFAVGLTLCLQFMRSGREMRGIAAVMISVAVALAAVGIYDSLVQIPSLRSDYFDILATEADRIEMLQQAGIRDAEIGSPQRYHFESRLQSPEPFVTFSLTNSLAGFLAPWFLVMLGTVLTTEQVAAQRRFLIKLLIICLVLAICLLLTKSRSAWCAILMGVGLLAAIQFKSSRRLVFQGLGLSSLLILVAVAIGWYTNRLDWKILSESFSSLLYRFEYWRSSFEMGMDHWLWGVGPGNFRDAYAAYKLPAASESIADPHNALLEIWTSFGVVVMLLFVLLGFLVVKRVVRPLPIRASQMAAVSSTTIFFSGLLGIVIAKGMDALGPGLIPDQAIYLGLPVFVVAIYMLQDWVEQGQITRLQIGCALVVWVLNLSMQSGISVPGIAFTGWLLVSMILNHDATEQPSQQTPAGYRKLNTIQRAGCCGLALILLLGFYKTCQRPVTEANRHMINAAYYSGQGQVFRAEQAIENAIAADPQSSKAYVQKTEVLFHRLQDDLSQERLQDYRRSMDRVLTVSPHSHALYAALAQQCFVVYQATGEKRWLQHAWQLTKRETEIYPNSAFSWGRRAVYESLLNSPTTKATATAALALDQQNPHVEFKLSNRRLQELDYSGWILLEEYSINNSITLEQLVHRARNKQ